MKKIVSFFLLLTGSLCCQQPELTEGNLLTFFSPDTSHLSYVVQSEQGLFYAHSDYATFDVVTQIGSVQNPKGAKMLTSEDDKICLAIQCDQNDNLNGKKS